MTFEHWLSELEEVMKKYYGKYEPSQARRYVFDNEDQWREYYDDAYSPLEAADEDQRSGVS